MLIISITKTIRMLRCLCFLGLFFLFVAPSAVRADMLASVTIQGIDGRLYENVTAYLSIFAKNGSKNLSKLQIESLHDKAEEEIKLALEPFGYYSPVIKAELTGDDKSWRASYIVNPGEPVMISAVTLLFSRETELDPEAERAAKDFLLKEGDVLDQTRYKSGKKQLLQRLFAYGYVKAEFAQSEIRINKGHKQAEIYLRVDPGDRFYFGETIFEQDLLDENFLAGFINYTQGEPYSRKKLLKFQQILYRTNYFSQVVVTGDIENAEGRYIPIRVRLREPEFYNRYNFGLGYATDVGIRGKIGWDNRLFNRYGHSISSELKLGQRESSLNLIYGVPMGDPRYDKLLFGAIYNEESWEDTDTRYFKGGLSYEHAGKRFNYGVGFDVLDENYEVGVTTGSSFLPIPHARWSFVYTDDLTNTRNGLFFSINLQGASDVLLGDTNFLQGLVSGKIITTPIESVRLIGRFSVGATLVESIDDLPPSLRFYAGGDQSVRGYGYKELGSRDASGAVVGGKYLVFGSIEVEKMIFQNWSIAAFLDTGKGINSLSEDLSKGVGAGLRYRLPFGQIRLDVASAISEDGNPLRLHLTLGGDF